MEAIIIKLLIFAAGLGLGLPLGFTWAMRTNRNQFFAEYVERRAKRRERFKAASSETEINQWEHQ